MVCHFLRIFLCVKQMNGGYIRKTFLLLFSLGRIANLCAIQLKLFCCHCYFLLIMNVSAMKRDTAFVEPYFKCELSKIKLTNHNTLWFFSGLTKTYFVLVFTARVWLVPNHLGMFIFTLQVMLPKYMTHWSPHWGRTCA